MKKAIVYMVAMAVVASLGSAAFAQDSALWLDWRDNENAPGFEKITTGSPKRPFTVGDFGDAADGLGFGLVNAGARGQGAVLRVEPQHADGWEQTLAAGSAGGTPPGWLTNLDDDDDASTGELHLYMDVSDVAGDDDVISSLGVNIRARTGSGNPGGVSVIRNTYSLTNFNIRNAAEDSGDGGVAVPWDGTNNGTIATQAGLDATFEDGLEGLTGAKAVRVPVSGNPPSYDMTVGYKPQAAPHRVATLSVQGNERQCTFSAGANGHSKKSTYELFLDVNNLLITRVFSAGGDAVESVAFGYDFDTGALDNSGSLAPFVSGSVEGDTSTIADAFIQVRMKGDGNGTGNVTLDDITPLTDALANGDATTTILQAWTYDFTGDARVTLDDIAGFLEVFNNRSPSCP